MINTAQPSDRIFLERTPELIAELRVVMKRTDCDPVRLAAREALIAICERVQLVFQRDPAPATSTQRD
jgi:hypothetical protein